MQVEDIIKVRIRRYQDKYLPGRKSDNPFVLYEKYSVRDCRLLMKLWEGFIFCYAWNETNWG
ncbi:MAG: DUF3427 domain-containing protein [Mediterraneibacter faecis]